MKKLSIISILLCLLLVLSLFAACDFTGNGGKNEGGGDNPGGDDPGGDDPVVDSGIKDWENNEIVESDSALYRDYYQIFVYSFADSNGDGIGDLKGIESKLDYIAALGFNGIWLTPIHPSSTEHCYDVEDYYGVNEQFGTLSDFKDLVDAAHERGISVMMDLVINHSSNKHPWFKQAQTAWKNKNTTNKYYDYYTFYNADGSSYATFETESTMPKLNLSSDNVRAEIENICEYWLKDYGVDAFRLDAAWHFYGKDASANVAFMQWLYKTAKKYNPDIYMVGEVWSSSTVVYSHYAENSVQSFFNFSYGTPANNLMTILNPGQTSRAATLANMLTNKENGTAKGIDALFASNHDTTRISGTISYVNSRTGEVTDERMSQHKMSIALLYTQTGNVFNYYGNEIGMRNGTRKSTSSDYKDYTYRTAMYWGIDSVYEKSDGFAYKAYGYSGRFGEYDDYLGGVAEQLDDQNSLLNFYRRVMLLRRQNPEIAQGKSTFISTDDSDLLVIIREYKGSKILMLYNLNSTDSVDFDVDNIISKYGLSGDLVGFLSSDNDRDVTMSDTTVTLPQFSIAVIR